MRLYLIAIFLFCTSMLMHIETVIRCEFYETDAHIEVNVSIEKEYASLLNMLNKKNDTSTNQPFYIQSIFKNDFQIVLNESKVVLQLEEVYSNHRGIQIKYSSLKKGAKINDVKLSVRDLLKNTGDHATIDIWLHLNNKKRLFKIKKNKLTINATY